MRRFSQRAPSLLGRGARVSAAAAMAAATLLSTACRELGTESRPVAAATPTSTTIELVVSDTMPAAGQTLRVEVHVRGEAKSARIASFTGRVVYDTTRLAFAGAEALEDGAIRATNPTGDRVRVAGAAAEGFVDGRLVVLRFTVRAGGGLGPLHVELDEVHTADRMSLAGAVRVSSALRLPPK